jgi:hypothetical protein
MKRLAIAARPNCRKARQTGLAVAAFALFALETACAQALPSAAIDNATAMAASSPTVAASATATADALQRISPSKIAPPNALLPAPTWAKLGDAQKTALMPLAQDWDGLDAARKSQWLEVAARFSALPAEEQLRLQERMREWARLSPAERQQARIAFQGAKKINPDERQAKWEAYQALPPEQRQQLADKAAKKLEIQASKGAALPGAATVAGQSSNTPQVKSNLVPAAAPYQVPKAVAATLVQAKPGATTVLITQAKLIPAHQQAGNPKVLANPDLVDSKTLMPKRQASAASAQ